jgi:excisionase family DNA binding protein
VLNKGYIDMSQNRRPRRKNPEEASALIFLSVEAICRDYGFHPNTIRKWVAQDRLRHIRYGRGRKIFINKDDVEAFIRQWYDVGLEVREYDRSDI